MFNRKKIKLLIKENTELREALKQLSLTPPELQPVMAALETYTNILNVCAENECNYIRGFFNTIIGMVKEKRLEAIATIQNDIALSRKTIIDAVLENTPFKNL